MSNWKNHKLYSALALTTALLLALTSMALAAVWTDQQDYFPGSPVTISGDNSNGVGYVPGNSVYVDVAGPNEYTSACDATVDDAGAWSCQVILWDSDLAVGEYTYTASSLASDGFTPISETGTFTDAKKETITSLASNPNPSNFNGSITFTASISAGTDNINCGTVDFKEGSTIIGTGSVKARVAILLISTLSSGTHNITAIYIPESSGCNYLGSTSSALTQTVNKAAATVTLGNMTQTYTGSPLTPTATTNPAGLTIVWTNAPQTGPGSYEVTATVNDTNYQGSASGTFVISQADNDAPTINCTVPNQANWYGSDVLVPCTASDSGSGLADPNDASFNLSTSVANGIETSSAQTNTHQVCDNNSNCATAGPYTFKVDRKAPVVSCGSADSIWHADNQSVACTSSDGGSGLANSADASFTLSTTVVSGDETASAATGSKTVADGVGNSSTAGPYTFKVDRKAPVVSCGSADSIWHADNQSVACTASDGGSGLANSADASFTLSTTVASGTETASASTGSKTVADSLGNSETAGPYTFKVDRKAPQLVSCDTSDGAWHATDVTLKCNYTDGGSGMTTAFVSLTTNVVAGTETTNAVASAGGAQACDNAGNCAASPANISGNRIDKKAPVLSCGSPDSIWHATDQSVTCTATDGGSGLAISGDASFTLSTNVPVGTEDNNASTGTHDVSDAVGNSATAGPVAGFMIDKKAPVINCTVPDQSIWYGNNVTVNCTASDAGSGLAVPVDATFTLSTSVASGVETASAATGSKMVSDGVGNSDTVGPYTFKVDKKGPSITINTPSATNYLLNQAIAANYSCSDGGSGLASCAGTVTNGSNIDTTTVGSKTFKVTATDNVGNTTSASVIYGVQYIFSGFSALVENMPIVNLAKAGQAIPIKWRQTDANGNPVSDPLNFTSVTASSSNASCGGYTDAIETYAGNSGLLYNGNGNWQFNWKTPKYYAGLCLTMKLTLSDGTTHDAYFSFK